MLHSALRRATASLCLLLLLLHVAGCSLFASSRQQISVSTDPAGARVVINGEQAGVTPLVHSINRSQETSILITKPGYETATRTTSRRLSSTGILDVVGGCIILLPFFGLLADGAWQQDPANFSIALSEAEEGKQP